VATSVAARNITATIVAEAARYPCLEAVGPGLC
jgi:hypothetical protein